MKGVGESHVDRVISREFIRVGEPVSQAAAVQDIRIHCGVFVSVSGAGRNGIALVVIQEDIVIADESQFFGIKKKLPETILSPVTILWD